MGTVVRISRMENSEMHRLLLDEMGPVELGPGEAKGAPDHPHWGFEEEA